LMAFNTANLNEIWNSSLNSGNSPGLWSKFRSPVVVNGKVYLGSIAGVNGPQATLSVYGLTCANVPEVTNVFINLNVGSQSTTPGPAILLLSAN
jgi:outer membrane protein assembly factor BamB